MVEILNSRETVINSKLPEIILGGMGVGITNYKLCRAAAMAGEKLGISVLPIVSGTGLSAVMVDRLQNGDQDAVRALQAFDSKIAKKIINKYSPKLPGETHKLPPKPEVLVTGDEDAKAELNELLIASAFSEVWLAKEGHNGPVGINLLEKIQLPILPVILGAIMAGVDNVVVGAGIPRQIPQVLKNFTNGETASYEIEVADTEDKYVIKLDPKPFLGEKKLIKPKFFPIISSHALAQKLNKDNADGIDGFIVAQSWKIPGHRAPARSKQIGENGEPIYGDKDKPNLDIIKSLGKPFWLAGGSTSQLRESQTLGATGIQFGTAGALSQDSGMREDLAEKAREKIVSGNWNVFVDPKASSSGYPFVVAQLDGTLSEKEVYDKRPRSCKYGFLVSAYKKEDGNIGFRCPSEQIEIFVKKGGKLEDTEGKVCLCAGLLATSGHAKDELPIVTLGGDSDPVRKLMESKKDGKYSAEEVVSFIASHK
jgi:nitronate monooxygenase